MESEPENAIFEMQIAMIGHNGGGQNGMRGWGRSGERTGFGDHRGDRKMLVRYGFGRR